MSVHPLSYFDGMYADNPDPWGFDRRPYERRKQDLTIAALPAGRHFARAVEPGCANGALTARLVEVCDEVIAFDPIASCVERATDRLDGTNARIQQGQLPTAWPDATVDLVVLSEVAYYLDTAAQEQLDAAMARSMTDDGILVAVHWTGPTNYPRTGEEVHAHLDTLPWLERLTSLVDPQFVLDVWQVQR